MYNLIKFLKVIQKLITVNKVKEKSHDQFQLKIDGKLNIKQKLFVFILWSYVIL